MLFRSTDTISQYPLTNPWDISPSNVGVGTTFTVIGGTVALEDVYVSPGGDYGFVLRDSGIIYGYSLPTPYDFRSRVSLGTTSVTGTLSGFAFKPDGTKFYTINFGTDQIRQYSLPSPWSFTSGVSLEKTRSEEHTS